MSIKQALVNHVMLKDTLRGFKMDGFMQTLHKAQKLTNSSDLYYESINMCSNAFHNKRKKLVAEATCKSSLQK
ncbi:hypothetical protein RDI58_022979 [Solanum bulbocastanum]|uniref:Uncharacterized protein n=1 Tax=Solanum bulbocastanum TaxID=147425 RepID=A0AAN8T538_SOLBU